MKSGWERQIPHDIAYIQNVTKLYKETYLQNRNRLRHRKETRGYQRGKVKGEG